MIEPYYVLMDLNVDTSGLAWVNPYTNRIV